MEMSLEQTKQLQEARAKFDEWKSFMVPLGMSVITDDGEFKTTIIGVERGEIVLATEIRGNKKVSTKFLLDECLLETSQGLMPCGIPPQPEQEIITPSDLEKENTPQFTIV